MDKKIIPNQQIAEFGSWRSPITSELIVKETIGLSELKLEKDDIYWIELRPSEGARNVIVRLSPDGKLTDLTPLPFNARTRVHEYGGGAFVVKDRIVYFSNFSDQRIYRQYPDSQPRPITPDKGFYYADGVIDSFRNRMICVREDHSNPRKGVVNGLVSLELDKTGPGEVIAFGKDFYSSPAISPDGLSLCWLSWNHPNMPWDGTELWVGKLKDNGTVESAQRIAGGPAESIFQPQWSPDNVLYFVSDKTGWWNLYCRENNSNKALFEMQAEFGKPQWIFGMATYAFQSEKRIICAYTRRGRWHLAALDTLTNKLSTIKTPYTQISQVKILPGKIVFIAGSPVEPASVVRLDLNSYNIEVLRRSTTIRIEQGYLSIPEEIEFPTGKNLKAHAFFYKPRNQDYHGPDNKLPPLIVKSHGGPTAAASTALSLEIQYWTSRGFAIVDVNYQGSTGYGRLYRQRLNGQWGVVDVDDCLNVSRYLVNKKEVDKDRLAIKGGSAGGYTTLCALTFHDLFKAGASYYGISDLEMLVKDTHKFESRYLDRLLGPYPQKRHIYYQRSPIHFIDRLSCPLIIFQGLEDKIVPPNQAELIYQALLKKGVPVAYLAFKGEQHGFRHSENIKRSLDAELYFYSKIFGFTTADSL
ncbi:MAG: S9 family peptidase, partial [Candidatus Omnitrophota bacterium]|nr:S9 family peptidase [Candidatus Omnitrophota bacterium]